MSKSGIRLLVLVGAMGGVFVGALYLVGARAVQHARRAPARVVAPPRVAPDVPVFTGPARAERPTAAARLAMLPSIAAAQRLNLSGQPEEIPPSAGGALNAERSRPSEAEATPDPRRLVLRQQLQAVLARHPNVELAFVTCRDADCQARAEARDLATLKAFIQDATAAPAKLKVEVHEHPSAFNGTTYRVDMEGPPTAAAGG